MQRIETLVSESDGFSIQGTIIALDNSDVVVIVTGGQDHIGALGLAVPRPSLMNPDNCSATSSILTMPGHKEDILVKDVSERLATATGSNVVVVAGIHYDELSVNDIKILRKLWIELAEKIAALINYNH